jgi:hypothetical protein
MSTPDGVAWSRRSAAQLLEQRGVGGVLISASRDPDAKLTFVITTRQSPGSARLVVKIPSSPAAGLAVDREGRMLVDIRRLPLGRLAASVPRYVESLVVDGRPVLVSTAVPGVPMSIGYHHWTHTARRAAVARDFGAAFDWLGAFQGSTTRGSSAADWPDQVLEAVRGRWDGHPALDRAVTRLEAARDDLAASPVATTAVHGDFWYGNLLVEGGVVSGVVDWENAAPQGSPLRDVARFVLSYSLYLDRHARQGRRVLGHRRLTRSGFAPGIVYGLTGAGWYPDLVQRTLAGRLEQLGVSPALWYDVALTGIGEVAASANADEFGAGHLELLGALPVHARRHRRPSR